MQNFTDNGDTVSFDVMDGIRPEQIKEKRLREYLFHYLEIVTTVTTVMLLRSGTDEALYKKRKLWRYIRKKDKAVYRRLRWGSFGVFLNLPGIWGRKIPVAIYQIARKIFGFN